MVSSFWRKLRHSFNKVSTSRSQRAPGFGHRLFLEALEDRMLLSIFPVTTTADIGTGSLRAAITSANGFPGLNTIQFNIPGSSPHVISPMSALPTITNAVIIDGSTEAGIVLDGTSAGLNVTGLTLGAGSAGSTVKRLIIDHFTFDGILIQSNGNTIQNNLIGTDVTGTLAEGNLEGIELATGTSGNVIKGNVISGNGDSGIVFIASGANTVQGNLIGLDLTGTKALGNSFFGVELFGSGSNVVKSNVISGNGHEGVLIGNGTGSTHNLIQGNLVGTDATGTKARGNGRNGIQLQNGARNNAVLGNVISGNTNDGISIFANGTTDNLALGNRIGTDVTSSKALPNGLNGVEIFSSATNNVIDANLISGNASDGVLVHDSGTAFNHVFHNLIGTTASLSALPNHRGVEIEMSATSTTVFGNVIKFNSGRGVLIHDSGTTNNAVIANFIANNSQGVAIVGGATANGVGGINAGQANAITANSAGGVLIDGAGTINNSILENDIFSNGGFGISLTNGGNNNQAEPTLLFALNNGAGDTSVSGKLHAAASTVYRVEFFNNPSGGSQGQVFLGFIDVTTDANGDAFFSDDFAVAATLLTATATDHNENTSSFSKALAVSLL
jgi:titin